MPTRSNSALSWIENRFSEGFLGKMREFFNEPTLAPKNLSNLWKGIEDDGKGALFNFSERMEGRLTRRSPESLAEATGETIGDVASLVSTGARDVANLVTSVVSGELLGSMLERMGKVWEDKDVAVPLMRQALGDVSDPTRVAPEAMEKVIGFNKDIAAANIDAMALSFGGGEGIANLGIKAYEKEFTKVAREAILAMQKEGFDAAHIKKIAANLLEAEKMIPTLADDTFAAVDAVSLGKVGSPTQIMRSTPGLKGIARPGGGIDMKGSVFTEHIINPREVFRPGGILHEGGHAVGAKIRYEDLDIGLGAKEKAIFETQQNLRDSLLVKYWKDKKVRGLSEAEGGFPLHELSPAELHAEAILKKIVAAYPNKLSMIDAFKQTLESTYLKAKERLLRRGEWPSTVRLLEGDPDAALGMTLMARIAEIKPNIKLKFDGIQDGFGKTPDTLQFTPKEGPLKGRTFNMPKGSSPEDVLARMEKMIPTKGTILREGGSKAPWVWSLLDRTLQKPEFLAAKEMKGTTLLNKLKKAGVSDTELEWTGLSAKLSEAGNKPIGLAEMRNMVKEKGIKTEVATSGSFTSPQIFEPRHESMFVNRPLPKGERYRESLITLKHEGKPLQLPEHYDPENVVVGMLADIRKTSEGSKAFHLQEGQSDWARKLRESPESTPAMPFKGDKALELGLKRMLWEASEEGAEKLTWTRGKDIAERWSLTTRADHLVYDKELGSLQIFTPRGDVQRLAMGKEELGRYVDPEVAKVLLEKGEIFADEIKKLEVGKRWPYEIYDKKIPAMLRKLTREVGEEVVPKLEGAAIPKKVVTDSWREELLKRKAAYEKYAKEAPTEQQRQTYQNEVDWANRQFELMKERTPVHSLDLPESLRQKIQTKGFKISRKIALQALEGIA